MQPHASCDIAVGNSKFVVTHRAPILKAVYFASGSIEEPLFAHYGLACPIYTHFTSPIRRYADVIVHRCLLSRIPLELSTLEKERLVKQIPCFV